MNVLEIVETIVDTHPEATLVSSLGTSTSAVRNVTDDGPHFYFGAAMGSAMAGALGLAEADPTRKVVAVIGDGECLMGMNSLWSISAHAPQNLTVVVASDGKYYITGEQKLPATLNLEGVANSLDNLSGATVTTPAELRAALEGADGPLVVEAKVVKKSLTGRSPFVDPAAVVAGVRAQYGKRGNRLD